MKFWKRLTPYLNKQIIFLFVYLLKILHVYSAILDYIRPYNNNNNNFISLKTDLQRSAELLWYKTIFIKKLFTRI